MKKQFRSIGLVLACVVATAVTAKAQVSGMPGDGIPDLYYFQSDMSPEVMTSFGPVSRPAGTMLLDADGYDIAAVLIGGPDVSGGPACDLCNNQELPASSVDGTGNPNTNTYTTGFAGGSSQWIRTSPLEGRAFVGVIGAGYVDENDQPVMGWPEDIIIPPFVNIQYTTRKLGLADYGPGLTDDDFTKVFDDGQTEALWSVRVAPDDGAPLFTNVTVIPAIPEPSAGLLSLAGLILTGFYRKRV